MDELALIGRVLLQPFPLMMLALILGAIIAASVKDNDNYRH